MPETFTSIATTECLPKKPVKTSLFLRLRANLLAYIERADTAPLGLSYFVAGNGNAATRSVVSHALGASVSAHAISQFAIDVSDDGGSTWTTFLTLTPGAGGVTSYTIELDWNTGEYVYSGGDTGNISIGTPSPTVQAVSGTVAAVAALGTIDAFRVDSSGLGSDVGFTARFHGGWR